MSADNVIQFVPRPNPNRKDLERQALEIMNVALIGPGGVDDLVFESSLGFVGPGDKEPA